MMINGIEHEDVVKVRELGAEGVTLGFNRSIF